MDLKPLTIQKALRADVEKFHELRAEKTLSPAQYLSELLKNAVNPVNNNGLQEKVNELTQKLQSLSAETLDFTLTKQSLLAEIETLKNQAPKTVEIEKKLSGTKYIFEPTEQMAKNMQRVIAYLKKEGKLNGVISENYLQNFTTIAINYLINNEYSNILK